LVTIEPILIKLQTTNNHPKTTHHAKLYLDLTTWVVWVNTGLPALGFLIFFSFFGFLVTRTGHTCGPISTIYTSYDILPWKDVPFGLRLIVLPI